MFGTDNGRIGACLLEVSGSLLTHSGAWTAVKRGIDSTATLAMGMFSAMVLGAFLRRLDSVAPMFEPFPQHIQTASR